MAEQLHYGNRHVVAGPVNYAYIMNEHDLLQRRGWIPAAVLEGPHQLSPLLPTSAAGRRPIVPYPEYMDNLGFSTAKMGVAK